MKYVIYELPEMTLWKVPVDLFAKIVNKSTDEILHAHHYDMDELFDDIDFSKLYPISKHFVGESNFTEDELTESWVDGGMGKFWCIR